MAISVVLTFNSTAYDISNYVMRHSIEVDEYLFNADNLRPNTNSAKLKLSRGCPYIDELFAWTGDVEIVISNDGTTVFTGYLTDNYSLKISSRGASDIELTAEDPGIKKLKTTWASTGGIVTNFSGKKVCDPADTANSFLHILAALAGVTIAATPPTISDVLYFSVRDADTPTYWDILDGVLSEYLHTFYFNAAGELALFALAGLTGTPSQLVESSSTILSKEMNGAGIEVQKRLVQYKEVVVSFKEVETISSIMVYQDATGQAATDCLIPLTAGSYYPKACDADTYSYVDYKLADGREVLSVGSITKDITVDSGITYSVTNLGKSAQVRFHNPTGGTLYIRRLRVTGNNVIAKKADSKCTSIGATGGKKLEASASYITATGDAKEYANLLRYFYANSGATYSFRAYHGNLYPSAALYPSTTLYPMGDLIVLGELVRLYDPIWTGLDVNCAIYRKSYIVGKAGAQYGAVGIGTITLSDAVSRYPVQPPMSPPVTPIPEIRNTLKALTTLSDTVDFTGQYGIYNGTRYIGTTPATWTRADAGQTETEVSGVLPRFMGSLATDPSTDNREGDYYYNTTSQKIRAFISSAWADASGKILTDSDVAGLVPTYTPRYLGKSNTDPSGAHNGDWYLKNAATYGIYAYTTSWARETTPSTEHIAAAWPDIMTAVNAGEGTVTDYCGSGVNFIDVLGANVAFISKLFAQDIVLGATGYIKSNNYAESGGYATAGIKIDAATGAVNSKSGKFVSADIKDATITNATVTGKATLSEVVMSGVTAGSNIVKSSDATVVQATGPGDYLVKSLQICASGTVTTVFELKEGSAQIYVNGSAVGTRRTNATSSFIGYSEDITINAGYYIQIYSTYNSSVRYFRIKINESPGILQFL
jgi:hypothetical protein